MSDDAWWLFGQMLRRKHNLGFQCDLMFYVLTIKGFAHIPLLLSHRYIATGDRFLQRTELPGYVLKEKGDDFLTNLLIPSQAIQ